MHLEKPPLFNFWYRRYMKWPDSLLVIRHDVSIYNSMKEERARNPLYQQFSAEFEKDLHPTPILPALFQPPFRVVLQIPLRH